MSEQSAKGLEPSVSDIVMQEALSSSQATSHDNALDNLYPSLAQPPPTWRQDLTELADLLERNYLSDPTTDVTR